LRTSRKHLCIQNAASAEESIVDLTFDRFLFSVLVLSTSQLCNFTPSKISIRVAIANSDDDITCRGEEENGQQVLEAWYELANRKSGMQGINDHVYNP